MKPTIRNRRPTPGLVLSLALSFTLSALGPACDGGASKLSAGISVIDTFPAGPRVIWDPLAQPVPEVPFPNDLLAKVDPNSGSGRSLNISEEATTEGGRRLRRHLNTLEGFGTTAPIMVSFETPLDLSTVTDESIVVINIEPGHPREGEQVMLDLGRYFPLEMNRPKAFWGWDQFKDLPDLFFAEGNTVVTDDGNTERIAHYEVESNTLWLRPLDPLALGAEYAVMLTKDLQGWVRDDAGVEVRRPVRSPFPFNAHAAQVDRVARGLSLANLAETDLAFGWTFTTADVTAPMRRIREGMHGRGALKHMADITPIISEIRDTDIIHDADGINFEADAQDHRYILQPGVINDILAMISLVEPTLQAELKYVDYMVFGSFRSPDVRTGEAGSLGVNTWTGKGTIKEDTVPFFIGIPKTTERHKPPFPVIVYFHGTSSSRLELLGVLDSYARQGIAAIAFDQVAHGPIIPDIPLILEQQDLDPSLIALIGPVLADILVPHRADEFANLEPLEMIEKIMDVGLFAEFAVHGRAEDKNGDGRAMSAEGFFWADVFRMCANFQQDMVDLFQVVRLLKGFDPAAIPDAIVDPSTADTARLMQNMLAGDFNADGVLDLGGPDATFGIAGISLGGFHASLGAALEDEIRTATPIAGGGGFVDVMLRTSLNDIVGPVMHELFGPFVVGCPDEDGGLWLTFNDDADKCKSGITEARAFAYLPGAADGGQVTLTNVSNGETRSAFFGPAEGFSVSVAADKWDQFSVSVTMVDDSVHTVLAETPYEGSGFGRNSPDARRFLGIGQNVMDHCDPLAYAVRLFREPFPGKTPVNILFENAIGDNTVPFSTGVHLARAAGALGPPSQWLPWFDEFARRGMLVGSDDYDIDDIDGDNAPGDEPIGPFAPVETGAGVATIRFANVNGNHTWVAAVDQSLPLDHAALSQNRMALFHLSGGTVVVDDPCIARLDCPFLTNPELLFATP